MFFHYILLLTTVTAVYDLIDIPEDHMAFIVMEQWSSQLIIHDAPCCLGLFLSAIRQCIEVSAI